MKVTVTRMAVYRLHRPGWRGWFSRLVYGNGPSRVWPIAYKPQTSAPWSL